MGSYVIYGTPYSNQLYRADVNFRGVDLDAINHPHGENDAIVKSFASNETKDSFDGFAMHFSYIVIRNGTTMNC